MSLISFNCECDNPTNRLDVRFTGVCDNSCPFCVEQHGREKQKMADPLILAEQTLLTIPDSVGILGGEPLLYPERVLEYVKLIRQHVPKIYITTSLPFTILGQRRSTASCLRAPVITVRAAMARCSTPARTRSASCRPSISPASRASTRM